MNFLPQAGDGSQLNWVQRKPTSTRSVWMLILEKGMGGRETADKTLVPYVGNRTSADTGGVLSRYIVRRRVNAELNEIVQYWVESLTVSLSYNLNQINLLPASCLFPQSGFRVKVVILGKIGFG